MNLTRLLMRLSIVIAVVCAGSGELSAQTVTRKFSNQPLQSVLKEIEQQTKLSVLYNSKEVNEKKTVTADFKDVPVEKVLPQILDKDLDFSIQNKMIVIFKKKDEQQVQTPGRSVTGTVVDRNGTPLIGALVTVYGTNTGTTADVSGNFSLGPVNTESVLEVSYMGYLPKSVLVGDAVNFRLVLEEDIKAIDEVVVVGYGTQRKSDITGSVTSVKAAELVSAPAHTTAQALQGRVAGVMVQNTQGGPSGSTQIRIRGANSLSYGNEPLVVIDGVQGGNIGSLNPNQIESVEILKDAAALAVYGSKGANGAILITTKRGKGERAAVSYNGFVSLDQVIKMLPALGAKEYATLFDEARVENNLPVYFGPEQIATLKKGTHWQEKIFREAISQNHNLSVSGAKESISYYVAGGLSNRNGIILNSNFQQYSLRANMMIKASKKFDITFNSFASYDMENKGEIGSAMSAALLWSPTKPVYEADGKYSQPGGGVGPVDKYNPVAYAKEIVNQNSNTAFNVAVTPEYRFWDFLKLSSQLAYRTNSTVTGFFDNQVMNYGMPSEVSGSKTQGRYMALQSTTILSFDKTFAEKHNVQFTGVYEIFKDEYNSTNASAKGIPVGFGYQGISYGTTILTPWIGFSSSTTESLVGRVNYSYANKYMFSASIRRDGASMLADGNHYDNFGAVSVGWNLMEERFMERAKRFMPDFKLRASYGSVGNSAVPAYSSQLKFSPGIDAEGNRTLTISQLENKSLRWERTREANLGIEARIWEGRINITVEYYSKKTSDLLMWQAVPQVLGVKSVLTNVGEVSNKGWDFAVGGIISAGHFKWDFNYTLNCNRNKILELDGISDMIIYEGYDLPGTQGSYVQMKGKPMGAFRAYTYAGVWQQNEASLAAMYGNKPGDAKYVDQNKDGKLDQADITYVGNAQPKMVFGFNNTFRWRNIDLNVFFQGVYGNKIWNQNRQRRESSTSTVALDHWTPTNPSNVPSFSGTEMVNSTRWLEDGSYLRLKSISIGYNLPQKWMSKIRFSSIRVYATGNNLWTITNYKGYDPEASMGMDAAGAGIDRDLYPSLKGFVFGLDINF